MQPDEYQRQDPEELKRIVSQAIDAFNERDLERYFSFHTEGTRITEPGIEGETRRDAYRALLEQAVSRNPLMTVRIKRLLVDDATVVMESEVRFDPALDFPPVPEAVVFDFVGSRIASTRVYSTTGFFIEESLNTSKEHHA